MPDPSRRALITGISGQDGSFLAEHLLADGYHVTGAVHTGRGLGASERLRERLQVIELELFDPASLRAALSEIQPDELYHLAAPSFVPESWRRPTAILDAIAGATGVLLEAVRELSPNTRMFVAGSSQMFGAAQSSPQHENSPCHPTSPYGTAKLAAHQLVAQLRNHDGLFACSGILYNHESERRPEHFVSRKITRGAAEIALGLADELVLGDLDAVRDWSFAGDIMHGAWLMLQQEAPDDYILASGVPHTVQQLADIAFSYLGLTAHDHIRVDSALQRAPEETPLIGDPSRARERLGWNPTLSFEELIQRMVDFDLHDLRNTTP